MKGYNLMTIYNNIPKPFIPNNSLKKQISWVAEKNEVILKSQNSSLRIALLAGELLYASLQYEGEVFLLTETNWKWILKYAQPDLVLIESCSESVTGHWNMAQTDPHFPKGPLEQMLTYAKQEGIPIAYWLTLDLHYLPIFKGFIKFLGSAYCADSRAVEQLKSMGIYSKLLLPAVQPALFSRLNRYASKRDFLIPVICDDLVHVIESWKHKSDFYEELLKSDCKFFDSRNQIWRIRTRFLKLPDDSLLGSVSLQSKIMLFKKSSTLAILNNPHRTRTDILWSILEAAASHMTILLEPGVDVHEFRSLCLSPNNKEQFFVELIKQEKDSLYFERVSQKNWRICLMEHTFSHRLKEVCQDLKIEHNWIEYPAVAMITPSYRKEFLPNSIKNFTIQTYPKKNWIMVYNGPFKNYEDLKSEIKKITNATLIYVPSELHAGPCMNYGIQKCDAKFVFRIDDDDHYGPNYLLDMILYSRVLDYDVIGKIFRYWSSSDFFPESIFERINKNFDFIKPSFCKGDELPEGFSFLAGCTHGGKKDFFQKHPYPKMNYGTVDAQWLDYLKEEKIGILVSADSLNLIVDRRVRMDHTWYVNFEHLKNNSKEYKLPFEKVVFV